MPASPPARGSAGSLLAVLLLTWCTGLAYLPVFGMAALVPVVTVASVAPILLAFVVSGVLRYPPWTAAVLSLVGALACGSATLYRERALGGVIPTPALARDMGGALVDAPQALLGLILPAPAEARYLVLVFVTVWCVGAASAELALRGSGAALPILPAALPMAGVPLLGVGGDAPGLPVTAAAFVAACLVVLSRSGVGTRRTRAAIGLPLTLAVALTAVGATAVLPGVSRHTLDLRAYSDRPPPQEIQGLSPLDRISAWHHDPYRPMFSVSAPGASPEQLWRLTVFDRFDGVAWQPVRALVPSGGRVPAGADEPETTQRLAQRITLELLPGPWLPAAERPVRVDLAGGGTQIAVDPVGGVLADGAKFAPGRTYTVESDVPVHTPEIVQFALTADDGDSTELPLIDAAGNEIAAIEALRGFAQEATAGASFPYQQALRLTEWLRTGHTFDAEAVPGHSYRNLQFFLETSKSGTSEQFATAFAVMARLLNLPARVVVGFRSPAAVDGVVHVQAGDVLAWAEVNFAGAGWVPFFPTPTPGPEAAVAPPPETTENQPPAEQVAAPPGDEAAAAARIRDEPRDSTPSDEAATRKSPDDGAAWHLWAWSTAVAVSAVLPTLLVRGSLARALRRRRRERGTPEERVIDAWLRAEELLRRVGMPGAETLTAAEVAAFGRRRLGDDAGEALDVLGRIYNEVLYAEPADQRVDRATAELARRCRREVEAAARAATRRSSRHGRVRLSSVPLRPRVQKVRQ